MNEFKDGQNRWLTSGLFEETAGDYKVGVRWKLDEAKDLFIATGDPTGYTFSKEHLGSWKQWKAMKASSVLGPIIEEWEEELEVAIRSEGFKQIDRLARDGSYQASKLLLDRGWEKRKAGKPSKEEVQRETRVQAKMRNEYSADIKRINRD